MFCKLAGIANKVNSEEDEEHQVHRIAKGNFIIVRKVQRVKQPMFSNPRDSTT